MKAKLFGRAAFPRHCESEALLHAPAEEAFAWLYDFPNLAAHMERPSGMMMGFAMRGEMPLAADASVTA